MQTPIDHLSRHNFITDPIAFAIFFFPLYGPLVVVIPFLFRKWHPRLIGLLISFAILFLLGLGGTTPLPRLFFGKAWEWLTYDRFAFWACLTLTPFFGMLFIQLRRKWKNRVITKPIPVTLRRNFLSAFTFFIFAVTALGSWFVPFFWANQPKPINMQPIVSFLNEGDRSQWRYLTFGFGNQYTYLNLLTKATTIDGSYHTARTLPELRESGIAEVDTAYWTPNGLSAIVPILQKSGAHSVRWGFVNPDIVETIKVQGRIIHRSRFSPGLEQLGWVKLKPLDNGILVYENPNAILPAPTKPPPSNPLAEFSWGIMSLLSLIVTLCLSALSVCRITAKRAIRYIFSFLIALIPISLCFWFFRDLGEFPHPRVYFIYTDILIFLTDALALLAVILWALTRITKETQLSITNSKRTFQPLSFTFLLSTLCLLATISIFWSLDWRTSLYISLHFWLIFLLILSLRDWHETWTVAIFGLCAGLSIQLITGFIGYAQQSTAFLDTLNMKWPGILDPSIRGVSVVQLANGLRILRAYGTLPHPNILGGFAFLTLLGPVSLFLANKKPNYPAVILLCLGIILIGLTFSRSAWLALVAFMCILVLKSKYFERKKLFLLTSAVALTSILTLYPLKDLVFTRVSNSIIATEQNSILGRVWYTQQAIEMIRKHPITGVGIGSFVIELSKTAIAEAQIEPVHNIFLLVTTELGIIGLLLMIGLFVSIALSIYRSESPRAILASATLTGFGIISLFDHYLWTLAPGRMLLGLALGLWAGQVAHDA